MFYRGTTYTTMMYGTLILSVLSVVIIGCSTSDTEKSAAPASKAVSEMTPIIPPETPTPVIPQVEATTTPSPATTLTATPTQTLTAGTLQARVSWQLAEAFVATATVFF